MAVPAITNFTIGCKKSTPFWFSAILNAEKKKGRESSNPVENSMPDFFSPACFLVYRYSTSNSL